MEENLLSQIMALRGASIDELAKKYEELFPGRKAARENKIFLWKQIAYKLQENEYGRLSVEAKDKLKDLVQQYDPINNKAYRPKEKPNENLQKHSSLKDNRLPIPGSTITKTYKGNDIQIKVLEKGFEYKGRIYKSLSAIAKEITGNHWNGYIFFGL
ncbi:MAG: DUF2924 domain-containing protein [Candidatus Omnitrophica bacterium]|nr:DUF2924 domain-containing protein [Candidatus Omnitrophota bacterium]